MLRDESEVFLEIVAGGSQQHMFVGLFDTSGVYTPHV
jgi:hypothetical protein